MMKDAGRVDIDATSTFSVRCEPKQNEHRGGRLSMDWSIQGIARLSARHPARCVTTTALGCSRPAVSAATATAATTRMPSRGCSASCCCGCLDSASRPSPRCWRVSGITRMPCSPTCTGCCGRRNGSTGKLPRSRPRSRTRKDVNNSWRKKCLTVSTTPGTRRRSRSAGARTRTGAATAGGAE